MEDNINVDLMSIISVGMDCIRHGYNGWII